MTTLPRALAGLLLAGTMGVSSGLAAAKPKLDPESAKFYQSARLIMTKEEAKIFERLPDTESRKAFIEDFWLKRDPDPDTPDNSFRKEFESRVAFVLRRFNKEGMAAINTDRGRVYILLGPPEKVEEFSPQVGSPVRGFTEWWSYYGRQLAVEFVDTDGSGRYRMIRQEGDFFGAMDLMKLGDDVRTDDVFSKKFVKFDAVYDAAAGEIEVRIPVKGLMFRDNEEGRLAVDLRFLVYIYSDGGLAKESFTDARSFVLTDAEHETLKTISARFARRLKPGPNYVDIVIMGKEGLRGKVRQIFEIKVAGGAR